MNKALKRLDSVHNKLIETVSPLEPALFSRRPSEDEWSVAEVVQHLSLVEERVIKDLEPAIAQQPQSIRFLKKFVPTYIVSSRLLCVKAPKPVNPVVVLETVGTIDNFN